MWFFLAAAVGGLICINSPSSAHTGWRLLNWAWLDVCMWLTVVPHEFAHALVGRAVGLRIFRVVLGTGRVWWRGVILGFDVEARSYLIEGLVIGAPRDPAGARWKSFAFILAGPLANVLMFGLAYLALGCPTTALDVFPHTFRGSQPFWGWQIFAFANLLVAIINFLPHTLNSQLGPIPSDGLHLFNLIFRPKTMNAQERHALGFALEAQMCAERQQFGEALAWVDRGLAIYPDDLTLLYLRTGVLINTGDLEKAREAQVQLLAKTSIPAPVLLCLKNDLAYVNALLGVPELMEEADRYSAEVMNAVPWSPNIRNTRGVVLLALGRLDEALPLLRGSVLEVRESRGSMSQCQSTLAIAEARRGNVAAAQAALEAARAAAPQCFLVPRAEAAVLAARGAVVQAA